MHIYLVFAHPSLNSFSGEVLDAFTRGLQESGHTYEVGDLYRMGFQSDMDVAQYEREMALIPEAPVPEDVLKEHEKINRADALSSIYMVWWSDCPAILKGWFDRVWNYGSDSHLHRLIYRRILKKIGIVAGMHCIIIRDRLAGVGIKNVKMEILEGMLPSTESFKKRKLKTAYESGKEPVRQQLDYRMNNK